MKKTILLLAMVCAMIALPLNAQVRFGFRGGIEVSQLKISRDLFDSENTAGFYFGPSMEFLLPAPGLQLGVAALYSQSGCKVKEDGRGSTEQSKSIEIPVDLRWSAGLGSMLSIFAVVGPQFGFNIDEPRNYNSRKFVLSTNFGGGLKILNHIQVSAIYNWGMTKLADFDDGEGGIKVRKNGWRVSCAYMF